MLKHKLTEVEMVNSVAVDAHKMLRVPVTCVLLSTKDLHQFRGASTLTAGFLFHCNDQVDDQQRLEVSTVKLTVQTKKMCWTTRRMTGSSHMILRTCLHAAPVEETAPECLWPGSTMDATAWRRRSIELTDLHNIWRSNYKDVRMW